MKILFKTSADHVYKSGLNRASYIMTLGTSESTNQKNQNKSNIKYKKEEIPLKPSEKPQIGDAFNQTNPQLTT